MKKKTNLKFYKNNMKKIQKFMQNSDKFIK